MKRIITILAVLLSFATFGQDSVKYAYPIKAPMRYDKVRVDSLITLPSDTLEKAPIGSLAYIYPCFYIKTPAKWGTVFCESVPFTITGQPASATVGVNSPIGFAVTVGGGTTPYAYQWKKNGSNISGATAHAYVIPSAQEADEGDYTVTITDAASATLTSSPAFLTVTSPDFGFSVQPINQTVNQGALFNMSATVQNGTAPYTFVWHFPGGSGSAGPKPSPTQGLNWTATETEDWYVVVTDGDGKTATSNTYTITVQSSVSFGNSGSDPYINNTTVPSFGSLRTQAYTANSNISIPVDINDADRYVVVKVPAGESLKTEWYNTALNQGTIPDITWRAPFTIGAYTYYVTREPLTVDVSQPIILRKP